METPRVILEKFLQSITVISTDRSYWIVRTKGGEYFEDFVIGDYIAIGYNKIRLLDLRYIDDSLDQLKEKIAKEYPDEYHPGSPANKLMRFKNSIVKGDIVMIPSENSDLIAFAEITDSRLYLKHELDSRGDSCPYEKRKKVRLIKVVRKRHIHPVLYKALFSHHSISNISDYAVYIDKTLHRVFKKGENFHIVVDVKKEGNIKATDLFGFGTELLNVTEDFNENHDLPYNQDEIDTKIHVESDGITEFITSNPFIVLSFFAIIMVCIFGGEAEISVQSMTTKFKSDGFIKQLFEYFSKTDKLDKLQRIIRSMGINMDDEDQENLLEEIEENFGKKVIKRTRKDELNN